MELVFIILAGVISLVGTVPYIWDTLHGTTKPRVASWSIWAVLTGIAAAASLSDGQLASGLLAVCMTTSCTLITLIAIIKNGYGSFDAFNVCCFVAALLGIVLWQGFSEPSFAVAVVVLIDAIASLPTVRHAWQAPHEETLFEFLMAGSASMLTLITAQSWAITAVAYPLFIVCFDLTVAAVLMYRRHKIAM